MGGIGKFLARLLSAMENLSGRDTCSLSERTLFVRFFLVSFFLFFFFFARDNGGEISRYPFEIRSIFVEIFSQPVYFPLLFRSLIALIDA